MARYIILKHVSTVYEISVEAKTKDEAIQKVWNNDYDNGDILSETDGDVEGVEFSEEVDTSDE